MTSLQLHPELAGSQLQERIEVRERHELVQPAPGHDHVPAGDMEPLQLVQAAYHNGDALPSRPDGLDGYDKRVLPRLYAHLQRKLEACSSQKGIFTGAIKVCPCGKVHSFAAVCGSILCKSCGAVLSKRYREKLSRDLAPCPHHYLVFTMPPELRTGTWTDIEVVSRAARMALLEVLGPHYFDTWERSGNNSFAGRRDFWGAWAAPHAYASKDLTWHPHLNVVLMTEQHLHPFKGHRDSGSMLKYRVPYRELRKAYARALEEVTGRKLARSWREVQVQAQLIKKPKKILSNLTGYSLDLPLPDTVHHDQEKGEVTFRVLHGSKSFPPVTVPLLEFLRRLDQLVPPKNFRRIRRWGVYHGRHQLYKDKPFTPINTKPLPEAACGCCGHELRAAVVYGRGRVIAVVVPNLDCKGFHSYANHYLMACMDSMDRMSEPPDLAKWLPLLEEEHQRCCKHAKGAISDSDNEAFNNLMRSSGVRL